MSLLLMFTSGQHTHTHKKKHNKRKQVGKKGGDAQGAASWVLHNWSWRTEHKRCGSAVAGLVGLRQRTKKERKQQSKQGQVGAAPTTKFLFLFPFVVSFFFLSFVFFFFFFLSSPKSTATHKSIWSRNKERKEERKKGESKKDRKMCTLTVDSQFTLARLTIHFTSHHSSPCRLHGKHKALRGLVFQKREREREREKKKKRNQVEQ